MVCLVDLKKQKKTKKQKKQNNKCVCVQCLGYMLEIALVLLQHCWFEEIR